MADLLERLKAALADRYRIEQELGSGGMATVYLAQDLKHERQVAIKVLRPELAAALGPDRFHQEIKIAANLHHPHILPLYDSGDAEGFLYYVMPYEEGQSLRDKLAKEGELPIAEAVRILRDVVDALSEAHDKGVVHRDIKPDNVLLTKHHALVTDFGVAKAVSEATGVQKLTTEGVALGTPAYMSPEQAAADKHIDHRADIYAVGALAYELLTGRPPFMGTTPQEVLAAHVTKTVEPVTEHRGTVPPALGQLVMKCLEKKPADRWQSAEELLPQLEALATPSGGTAPTATAPAEATSRTLSRLRLRYTVPILAALLSIAVVGIMLVRQSRSAGGAIHSIAVLPIENATADSTWDIVAEGLTRELITALTNAGVPVKGYRSVADYRHRDLALKDIAEELGADALAIGSLVGAGESVQVMVEVTDPATAENRWATIHTSGPNGLPTLGTQLARELVRGLGGSISPERDKNLATAYSPDPAAFNAYLLGKHYADRFTLEGFQQSVKHLRHAVQIDSLFSSAWASLGYAYEIGAAYGFIGLEEGHAQAQRAVETALALNAGDGLAHLVLAFVYQLRDNDWASAEREHRRAIELSPTSDAYITYGVLLERVGRVDEAVKAVEQAVVIDPTSALAHAELAWKLTAARDYDRALTETQIALELDSTYAETWWVRSDIYGLLGRFDDALLALDRYEELSGATRLERRVYLYAVAGREEDARALLTGKERLLNWQHAWIHVALGDWEVALSYLERAVQEREYVSLSDPQFDPIRHHHRFQALERAFLK